MARLFEHRWLLIVLLIALAIRVGWGLAQSTVVDERLPDQHEYLQLARSLAAGEGFRFYDPRFQQDVYAYRTPGYPLFLAACGGSVRVARLMQALLDTSTVLAVYLLARRWLEYRWSLLAAALVAANPFLVYFSALILSETLFVALLTWGLVLLAWRSNYLWGGIVLALSVLVRPSAVGLPLFLGLAAMFVTWRPAMPNRRLRLPVGATMLLLTLAFLFPWALRNHMVLGKWIWLTTNGGVTLYDGFHPRATGASDQRFFQEPEMASLRRASEIDRDECLSELAKRSVGDAWTNRPGWLLRLTAAKIARLWSPIPLSDEFGRQWLYRAVALGYTIPLDVLVVLGVWGLALPRRAKVLLLLPAVYLTAVHALSVGSLRYRMPAEPALAIIAAAGVAMLFRRACDAVK